MSLIAVNCAVLIDLENHRNGFDFKSLESNDFAFGFKSFCKSWCDFYFKMILPNTV